MPINKNEIMKNVIKIDCTLVDLVSLFNGMPTFVVYLMPKLFLSMKCSDTI